MADRTVVLVITHRDDDHVPMVVSELDRRQARVVRFNTEDYPEHATLWLAGGPRDFEAWMKIGGLTLAGTDVGAVWYRHVRLPLAPSIPDDQARVLAESELLAALEGTLLALKPYWLNHPHANRAARHKPLQLALAVEEGLEIPDTCITSDPDRIRSLYSAWQGRMVAKLVGGQLPVTATENQFVVYTALLDEHDLVSDAVLAACPALYQRYVEKAFELRVTIIGGRIFTCRIESQESDHGRVDWRRGGVENLRLSPYELDHHVAARLLRVIRRLGLESAGVDLIVTPEGKIVFLEVNAAGQWAWIERATGMPISAAVAECLVAGAGSAQRLTP